MIIFVSTKKIRCFLVKIVSLNFCTKKTLRFVFCIKKKNRMARYTYNTLETKPKSSTSITSPADISWS